MGIDVLLYFENSWEWFCKKSKTKTAEIWLGIYSFFESFILPFPTDIFLALMVLSNKEKVVRLVVLTTLTGILGAIALYTITALSYSFVLEPLVIRFDLVDEVLRASEEVKQYVFLAAFLGALTPFPYTPVVLAAGLLRADLIVFVVASLIGRSIRYTVVAAITYFFGVTIIPKLGRWATLATVLIILFVAVLFFFVVNNVGINF